MAEMGHLHRARFDRATGAAIWILCLGDVPGAQTMRAVHDRWIDRDQAGPWPGCPLRGEHEPIEVRSLAGGHFEAGSQSEPAGGSAVSPPVALDWQTSTEHRGLQGVAFPECITRGEQGALL